MKDIRKIIPNVKVRIAIAYTVATILGLIPIVITMGLEFIIYDKFFASSYDPISAIVVCIMLIPVVQGIPLCWMDSWYHEIRRRIKGYDKRA